MSKIRITNSSTDSLLKAAGKARIVVDKGAGTSHIENSQDDKIKIQVLSSILREESENIYEVAKIKIEAYDKSRTTILNFLSNNSVHYNYDTSMPILLDRGEVGDKNVSKATPSYSAESKFNYVSEDYDSFQISTGEINMLSFLDESSKEEFLNFKKLKNPRVTNYSNGSAMKNFVVSQDAKIKHMDTAPYYTKININDNIDGGISHFLKEIDLYDEVLNEYLNSGKQRVELDIQTGTFTIQNEPTQIYQVPLFFSSDMAVDYDNFFGINKEREASKMSVELRKHMLKGYLKNSTKLGFRTFSDILSGVECHKETLCYSVEKYDNVQAADAKIQTFFAPPQESTCSILDTQVKYGKTYVYRCMGHYMMVANTYRYTNVRIIKEDENYYATCEIINEPFLAIMPLDIFNIRKSIIQPPPVAPQVHFKTENNSSQEMQIYLSPTKSEIREVFIPITSQDEKQLAKMEEFYEGNGMYTFKTTGETGLYEIFRMDHPPMSYADFANKKISEVRMSFTDTAAIFKDSVESNKEYYYTFRKINDKGLVSNPTSIYKATLVVDADDAKVMLDTYKFPEKIVSTDRASFKSMFQVKPSVEQYLFDEDQKALDGKTSLKRTIDELQLGVSPKSVWGKKFKLRVRSKTSGKIIDLNINFELSKNKTKEEF